MNKYSTLATASAHKTPQNITIPAISVISKTAITVKKMKSVLIVRNPLLWRITPAYVGTHRLNTIILATIVMFLLIVMNVEKIMCAMIVTNLSLFLRILRLMSQPAYVLMAISKMVTTASVLMESTKILSSRATTHARTVKSLIALLVKMGMELCVAPARNLLCSTMIICHACAQIPISYRMIPAYVMKDRLISKEHVMTAM